MPELVTLLAPAFIGCVLFVAIHECFGVHVLRRGVIFVDLALAQMSALGATLAFAAGHDPASAGGIAYTLFFAVAGAALLTLARTLPKNIHPEAYIGIVYVVSTAATIVAVDRSPQGAEHVKELFIGSIVGMSFADLPKLVVLYGAIGAALWLARRPIARASEPRPADAPAGMKWDFLFYFLFGLVVTSSVAIAGVLLVFCFLIIPAIVGSLFSARPATTLLTGWISGVLASAMGLAFSYAWDLPAGASLVIAFAAVLLGACLVRSIARIPGPLWPARLRGFARTGSAVLFATALAAMVWLIAAPHADQPLVVLIENLVGTGPQRFLTPGERARYEGAVESAKQRHAKAELITQQERNARWQGDGLSDDTILMMGTFQQAYNEMARGDDFVVRELTGRARERERTREAPIVIGVCVLGLWLVLRPRWPARFASRFAP
jgi:zinc/manganese transport system permease protein